LTTGFLFGEIKMNTLDKITYSRPIKTFIMEHYDVLMEEQNQEFLAQLQEEYKKDPETRVYAEESLSYPTFNNQYPPVKVFSDIQFFGPRAEQELEGKVDQLLQPEHYTGTLTELYQAAYPEKLDLTKTDLTKPWWKL
jgi:hypothetical protein